MNAASCTLKNVVRRTGRMLAAGLCAVLAMSLSLMALAVFVQALAVLVMALLAAALLLPHPLSWYAGQGGRAAGAFFDGLVESFGKGKDSVPDKAESPPFENRGQSVTGSEVADTEGTEHEHGQNSSADFRSGSTHGGRSARER